MMVILGALLALVLVGCVRSDIPSETEVQAAFLKARDITLIKTDIDILQRELNKRLPAQCPLSLAHGKRVQSDAKTDRKVNSALLATRILMLDYNYSLDEINHEHVREMFARVNGETCDVAKPPTDCDFTNKYRTADGSCNNVKHPEWGMAGRNHERVVPNEYDDKVGLPRSKGRGDSKLPNPRTISNVIHRNKNPDGNVSESETQTLHIMTYGQFLDHDITLTPEQDAVEDCCDPDLIDDADNCISIIIEEDDPYQEIFTKGYCMNVKRSAPVLCPDSTSKGVAIRQQKNANTAFIDNSNVYGSSQQLQDDLRDKDKSYLLKTIRQNKQTRLPDGDDDDCILTKENQHCSNAGDVRVNEVPPLTSYHFLFVREHNRIAKTFKDFFSDDETIFQETRKLLIAISQKITYEEFLPSIMSKDAFKKYKLLNSIPYVYQPETDPTTINVFATAAYRVGHSWVTPTMLLFNNKYDLVKDGSFLTEDTFHNPDMTYAFLGNQRLSYWLTGANSLETDSVLEDAVRNSLFIDRKENITFDLGALNIQRGRGHGLGSYDAYRRWCGLGKVKRKWNARNPLPDHDREMTKLLQDAGYKSPRDIDVWIGGISETPVSGGSMGPTFECIIGEQFHRLKYGDRFWFQSEDSGFTAAQLEAVGKYSFSKLLCNNYNYKTIQHPNAFKILDEMKNCDDIPDLDLEVFKPEAEVKKQMSIEEELERLIDELEGDKK